MKMHLWHGTDGNDDVSAAFKPLSSVLRNIFKQFQCSPIYLAAYGLNNTQVETIRDAMIENPRFTFICPEVDLDRLL